MARVLKYTTTTPSGSIRKGNIALSTGNADYGTSFYTGIEPPAGGYVVYQNKATGGPSIKVAADDTELINITREISGGTYGSAQECLDYYSTQTDKIVIASSDSIPNVVTDGLVLNLNADVVSSYPTTDTIWYDLSGNAINGTLTNGPTFNSDGSIVFDGVDDYVNCGNNTNPLINPGPSDAWSLSATFKNSQPLVTQDDIYGIAGKRESNTANGYTLMLRGSSQYKGVLARLTTSGQSLVDIYPTSDYSSVLSNGNYHQMVMTYGTNDTGSLYIDGTLVGQAIATNFNFNNSLSAFKVGVGDTYNSHPFNGNIANVSFYNKALSQSEILQNFAASGYPRLVEDAAGTTDSDFSIYTGRVVNTLTSQDLYFSSSLVLTAAGYGTGSLYALKPVMTGVTSSRASTSTRLTNGGNLLEIAADVPNISYPYTDDKPYYLIEPQSTNLLTYSNNPFNNSNNWGNRQIENVTATLYDTIGDVNILKLTEGTNNGQHRIGSGNNYTGGNYTGTKIWTSSFYAKPNGRSRIVIYLDNQPSGYIDLEAGTTTLTPSGYLKKSKVTKLANGYCYVEITFSKTNATSGSGPYYIEWLADNNNNSSYQGDGTSGILMYGYQIEEMQFGTSYIKTNAGSTVTRTASSRGTHLTGLQSKGILSSTGTVYIEGFYKGTSYYYQYVFGQTGVGGINGVSISTNQQTPSSTYSFSMRIYKSNSFVGDITLDSSYYDGKPFKMCFKYDGTNCHFFYNGVYKGYLQFSGASIDSFFTGTENTSGNTAGNGSCLGISSMSMFPAALSDDQCLTLTR